MFPGFLFVYVSWKPIIKLGYAPYLYRLETQFVNNYCGEILFTANGYFEIQSSSTSHLAVYFFHFEDHIPCSSAEGLIGMDSEEIDQTPFFEQLSKIKDNFFTSAKYSPGQAFWGAIVRVS